MERSIVALPPYFRGIGSLICLTALVWAATGWMVVGTGSFYTTTVLIPIVLGQSLILLTKP